LIHLLHSFLIPPTSSSPNPGNLPPPAQGKNKENFLRNAVHNGHHLLVRYLVEQGAKKDNMMHLACAKGHLPVVRELIRAGADIDEKGGRPGEEHRGYTPLYMACSVGHLPIAQELILAGAAVDKAIMDKILHYAREKGHLPVVRELKRLSRNRFKEVRKMEIAKGRVLKTNAAQQVVLHRTPEAIQASLDSFGEIQGHAGKKLKYLKEQFTGRMGRGYKYENRQKIGMQYRSKSKPDQLVMKKKRGPQAPYLKKLLHLMIAVDKEEGRKDVPQPKKQPVRALPAKQPSS
jgi:hypothetical protein